MVTPTAGNVPLPGADRAGGGKRPPTPRRAGGLLARGLLAGLAGGLAGREAVAVARGVAALVADRLAAPEALLVAALEAAMLPGGVALALAGSLAVGAALAQAGREAVLVGVVLKLRDPRGRVAARGAERPGGDANRGGDGRRQPEREQKARDAQARQCCRDAD